MRRLVQLLLAPPSRFARLLVAEKRLTCDCVAPEKSCRAICRCSSNLDGTRCEGLWAIVDHLEGTYPDHPLAPEDDEARRESLRLLDWAMGPFLENVTKRIVYERASQRLHRRGGAAGARHGQCAHGPRSPARGARKRWGTSAERNGYLTTRDCTLGDLAVAAHLSAIDYFGEVPWTEFPAAAEWYMRMKSRPSFRNLLADRVPGQPPVFALCGPRRLSTARAKPSARVPENWVRCGALRPCGGARRRGRTSRAVPRGRPARHHGLAGEERRPPLKPICAVARGALDRGAGHELRASRRSARAARPSRARRHLRLRARRRLPRRAQIEAEDARPIMAGAICSRCKNLRRHRARDGETARAGGGARLAGQAHQSRLARIRLLAVPRLDLHHARDRARRARNGSLRFLPPLPRHLPDQAFTAPYEIDARAAFPISPSSTRDTLRANSAWRWATASMAATIAWRCAPEQLCLRGARGEVSRPRANWPRRVSRTCRVSTIRLPQPVSQFSGQAHRT